MRQGAMELTHLFERVAMRRRSWIGLVRFRGEPVGSGSIYSGHKLGPVGNAGAG